MTVQIPPAEEQLKTLELGAVDLNPRDNFVSRLQHAHTTQTPLRIKAGFDPTAPDLHLGHTVLMEKMAQFQRLGHEVTFLVGDYTARIGDPTGRNQLRPPLSGEEIDANAKTYTAQAFKILDASRTQIQNNSTWLEKLSFADTIALASKYNVGRMLERRDFRSRFDNHQQIAIHEFLYPLMQGYDSVMMKADVELGGHDQIFNLNVGRHLMEAYGQKPQCVLTVGLLVGLDGHDKMSKSKNNHIGITDAPENMFGKVMSISDDTMWGWYPLLTSLDVSKLKGDPLEAKKSLARLLVERFHSGPQAERVLEWWNAGRPASENTVESFELPPAPLFALLVQSNSAESNSDARRKIKQGGVRIDDARASDPNHELASGSYLLKVGKKRTVRIHIA